MAEKASRARPRAPADSRPTLRSLAVQLGLSPASVSLVLNHAPAAKAIPKSTQDRIRHAAAAVGYRPNSLAKSLRHRRTLTVGVMVPEISEGYSALVMSGIEDALMHAGYLYFVAGHRHRADLIEEYPRLMLDRAVDGLIVVDTSLRAPLPVPVVAVSGHDDLPGLTNIVLDHAHAASYALAHLKGLGHRRIAYIKGQRFSSDTAVRWTTIREAARAHRLPVDNALVGQLAGESPLPDLGYAVTQRLLAVRPRFTALFAFNDISALGAIRAIREAGLRVPEDVSVVGFDDIASAAYQNPGLTTVRQPLYEMGQRAADTLVARLERPDQPVPQTISLEPSLIVRGTTARAR
ncbi:MAG: LacI family DNA-binding transcriptional regulator [Vicinamibacteraceae bacterium]